MSMIEIKLAQLRSPQFAESYGKLMKATGLNPKAAYHVARVGTLLEQERKAADEAHTKLVEKWAEHKNENGQSFFQVPEEKLTEWTAANKEFHEATATVDKRKLFLSEIESAALTPADYLALEPVISETELQSIEGGI